MAGNESMRPAAEASTHLATDDRKTLAKCRPAGATYECRIDYAGEHVRLNVADGAEEAQPADPKYPCCRFRGSVSALDASSGMVLWKTYTLAETPRETGRNPAGTPVWGPSGSPVTRRAPPVDEGSHNLRLA